MAWPRLFCVAAQSRGTRSRVRSLSGPRPAQGEIVLRRGPRGTRSRVRLERFAATAGGLLKGAQGALSHSPARLGSQERCRDCSASRPSRGAPARECVP